MKYVSPEEAEKARLKKLERQKKYEKESGYAAKMKYQEKNTKAYCLRFMVVSDADIIEKINSVPNKNDYIRNLIRADIAKEK